MWKKRRSDEKETIKYINTASKKAGFNCPNSAFVFESIVIFSFVCVCVFFSFFFLDVSLTRQLPGLFCRHRSKSFLPPKAHFADFFSSLLGWWFTDIRLNSNLFLCMSLSISCQGLCAHTSSTRFMNTIDLFHNNNFFFILAYCSLYFAYYRIALIWRYSDQTIVFSLRDCHFKYGSYHVCCSRMISWR